jgi:ribonuclease VapC
MFLDASAIIALLAREPDAERIAEAIDNARGSLLVSPLARFEATTGLARAKSRGRPTTAETLEAARAVVTAFLETNSVREIPVSANIGQLALDAAARFGRVVGHPADLNFGDCFAYACAKDHRAPLLFKGDDFSQTDVNDQP